MEMFEAELNWVYDQQSSMIDLLQDWGNINSCTDNMDGLEAMLQALKSAFAVLGGKVEEISLPPRLVVNNKGQITHVPVGKALRATKHPLSQTKVLLGGHMDTVYPLFSPFQNVAKIDSQRMQGPGITDMKGGLVVMLKALEALERSQYAGKIGWEVIINSDEEEGSPSSTALFTEAAKRNQIGLVYEPAFSDGRLVSSRKGSVNYTLFIKGRSAHAGRDFFSGKSAISAIATLIVAIEELTNETKGITVNVGRIEGGYAPNIVPDFAICRFNIRIGEIADLTELVEKLNQRINECNQKEGIAATLIQTSSKPPKPFDEKNQRLFDALEKCALDLNINLKAKPSGGVCDGNTLSAAGLPTIDTLGVVGGNIHTHEEYILLDSLTERAALSTLFLMKLANLN